MANLELAKYYAQQAKKVYDSTSYDDLHNVGNYERWVIDYSDCPHAAEYYDVLLNAYYTELIDVDELIAGLTEVYEESGA